MFHHIHNQARYIRQMGIARRIPFPNSHVLALPKMTKVRIVSAVFLVFATCPFAAVASHTVTEPGFSQVAPGLFVSGKMAGFCDDERSPSPYSEEAIWQCGTSLAFGWLFSVLNADASCVPVSAETLKRLKVLSLVLLSNNTQATDDLCHWLYGYRPESVPQDDLVQIGGLTKRFGQLFGTDMSNAVSMTGFDNRRLFHCNLAPDTLFPCALELKKTQIGKSLFLWRPGALLPEECHDPSFDISESSLPEIREVKSKILSRASIRILDRRIDSFVMEGFASSTSFFQKAILLGHGQFVAEALHYPDRFSITVDDFGSVVLSAVEFMSGFFDCYELSCYVIYGNESGSLEQNDEIQFDLIREFANKCFFEDNVPGRFIWRVDVTSMDCATLSLNSSGTGSKDSSERSLLRVFLNRKWTASGSFFWTVVKHEDSRPFDWEG